ncbi:MAG: GntG family PLP-dependent aldolase [Acidimicrobiia bacterium]|nr:GntG family PLP-dependent aldolase [Acidimicrobiia bacterium]
MAFPDGIADFRSDTVTRPTAAMRQAMAAADVGDDVYGEDPTGNALEEEAAALVGKDAAVFVPSGSMGNLLGLVTQARPGDEVLCVETAHVRNYEMGAAAAIGGLQFRTVANGSGEIKPSDVAAAIEQSGYHFPRIAMLAWENTHNWSGGTVVPFDLMRETSAVARAAGLRIHLDGARLWNAVAATGIGAHEYAAQADTVQFCFSKGLGAPIGSILCGPADVILEARFLRKRLGGGMRQVGVIAAAAALALESRGRLGDDHLLAQQLGEGVGARFPEAVSPEQVQTNMVVVHGEGLPVGAGELQTRLAEAGVLVGSISKNSLRFVTHRDVDSRDVGRVLDVLGSL